MAALPSADWQWENAVAGAGAGLATVTFSHPLDVVRTRFQVYDGRISNVPAYRNTPHALFAISRSEGFRGLYTGFYSAVLGSTISWGLYFLFYSKAKQRYLRNREELSPGLHLASAVEEGVLVCFCTNPLWLVKKRLQLQTPNQIRPYTGFHDALRTIIKGGWEHFTRGLCQAYLWLHMVLFSSRNMRNFAKFLLARKLRKMSTLATAADLLDSVDYATLGTSSKLAAILTTYPFQQRPSTTGVPRYMDSWHIVKETAGFEGVGGFYRGIMTNMLKNVPAVSVTFFVYENILNLLKLSRREY